MLKYRASKLMVVITALIAAGIIFAIIIEALKNNVEGPPTTKTLSSQFSIKAEKLEFLKKYIKEYSEIIDAEYYIEFHNNSGIPPAPSEWNIRVALKIPNDKIEEWTAGFDEVDEGIVKLSWWDLPNLNNEDWHRNSNPKYYKRKDEFVYMVVYDKEGIILKKIVAM